MEIGEKRGNKKLRDNNVWGTIITVLALKNLFRQNNRGYSFLITDDHLKGGEKISMLMIASVLIQHEKVQKDQRHWKTIIGFIHVSQGTGTNILGTPNEMHHEVKRGEPYGPMAYSA
jgi:hypothetical protein